MSSANPNFSVTLKSYGKTVNLPVFKADTISTLIDRIEVLNPHDGHSQSRESIEQKIAHSLKAVLVCPSVPLGFKKKIEQFLESDVNNNGQQDQTLVQEQILSEKKSDNKKLKKKGYEEKKSKKGQFSQLYKMTKNIFKQDHAFVGEPKQTLIRMRERNSRINRCSNLGNAKSSLDEDKENDMEIMKRIEQKILSYERNHLKAENKQHKSPIKRSRIESASVENQKYSYSTQVSSKTPPVELSPFLQEKAQFKQATKMSYNYIASPGGKCLKYEYASQNTPQLKYHYANTKESDKKTCKYEPPCSQNVTFYGSLDMRKKSLGQIQSSMVLRDQSRSIINDSSQGKPKRFNYL